MANPNSIDTLQSSFMPSAPTIIPSADTQRKLSRKRLNSSQTTIDQMDHSQEVSSSNAQNLNVREESEQLISEEENITRKKCKRVANRSPYWDPYDLVKVCEGDPPVEVVKGRCKACKTLIAADSYRNDTSALKKHTISCNRRQAQLADQTLLNLLASEKGGEMGTLTSWKFDQRSSRMALCEMILLDELPFRFVEHEGFKKFVARICPQFSIPCRKTIKEDCIRLFLERTEVLKSFFAKKGTGRVSITTDCWTAVNNTSFICVTAHFIGYDWSLQKKIISFKKILGHKGDDIADSVIESLNEWDLNTIFCCTMDNATANDKAIHNLRGFLENRKTILLGGKYLHLRCVAHIINLIVADGLEEIDMSVRRVREAVKWIKASPVRSGQFQICVKLLEINCKRLLSLDVPTRWNSTYLMLQAAEPYEEALKLLESRNSSFVSDLMQKKHLDIPIGPPNEDDWVNVRKMIEYLKKFYELTRLVSGTSYVTSPIFFMEICDLFDLIFEFEKSTDIDIAMMATKMKMKVGKYWLEADVLNPKMNKLLYIAAVLDPRQKMKHVERCLKKVYGNVRAFELGREVRDLLFEMFDVYKKVFTTTPSRSSTLSRDSHSQSSTISLYEERIDQRGSCSLMLDSSDDDDDDSDTLELTLYLAEKYKKGKDVKFDILDWWSMHGLRFPILSKMARDILAVPISTVASESAFSTGGRVLDVFRSSLSPSTVEALICAEDWLRSSSTLKKDEEDQPEDEQEEEFQKVLSSMTTRV